MITSWRIRRLLGWCLEDFRKRTASRRDSNSRPLKCTPRIHTHTHTHTSTYSNMHTRTHTADTQTHILMERVLGCFWGIDDGPDFRACWGGLLLLLHQLDGRHQVGHGPTRRLQLASCCEACCEGIWGKKIQNKFKIKTDWAKTADMENLYRSCQM
jgi:hypothetical protein